MSDNMQIWNAVSKTDPAYTKTVNQRGGFTAIGANYQIMMATKQFGAIGTGWGYEAGEPIFKDQFVIVPVSMWHGDRSNTFGPVFGCAEMFGKRPDSDAPKKAGTDGLTKLLSQLGFNADVFLGMFDDNKYIEQRRQEVAQESVTPEQEAKQLAAKMKTAVVGSTTLEVFNALVTSQKYKDGETRLHDLSPKAAEWLAGEAAKHETKLKEASA